MLQFFSDFLKNLSSLVWGLPLLIILIGGGIFLIVYSRFLPFLYLRHAILVLLGKYDNSNDRGELSHLKALTTALSATVGMGNISGVAVAISIGGPGAVFWMWISAIIGMNTKFFTATLAILYRGKDDQGKTQGGPMYFIEQGLGKKWKPLAWAFGFFGMIGALPVFNVNQLSQAIQDMVLIPNHISINIYSKLTIGIVLALLTYFVFKGGLKRLSQITVKLVPTMVLLYFVLVIIIIIGHADEVVYYLKLIFTEAFAPDFYQGDTFFGGVLGGLILHGIKRGSFSNEAGIGTAPLAHGAAKTEEPIREGLVAMLGPAIDTLIVCTLTALAILVTGVWQTSDAEGVSLTASAFTATYSTIGKYLLLCCIVIFSISSLFSYSYYGTKCMSYLFGSKTKKIYEIIYLISIIIGATATLDMMINLIDSAFALMAIPTMTATLLLAPKVKKEMKKYFNSLKSG